jgi:hypothetical protein
MTVLRIEHTVPDYEAWKLAFDGDPAARERSGVRRYRILRAVDDPNDVMIDLEFDSRGEAEAMLTTLRAIWGRVQGTLIGDVTARLVEPVETAAYPAPGSD